MFLMKKFLNKLSALIGGLVKATLILLVLLLVLPLVYFAWRAGQPMSMSEYGGRSYYELLSEREAKYSNLAEKYQAINEKAFTLGGYLSAPFMTLSFMALLVIPELKLSDKGLFDGIKFAFTDLFESPSPGN